MAARQKLNQWYVNGSLFAAAVIGGITESWLVFGLALLALVALNVHSGNIRLEQRKRPPRR